MKKLEEIVREWLGFLSKMNTIKGRKTLKKDIKVTDKLKAREEELEIYLMNNLCNVGLLDEQIPKEIKEKYPNLTHEPAYFDYSGIIIQLDFSFDNFGVKYINFLENKLKEIYSKKYDLNNAEIKEMPLIVRNYK